MAANSAALRRGASQLAGGLGQLNAQVPTLTAGVNQLANGTQQLNANSPKLADGALQGLTTDLEKLRTGANELSEGSNTLSTKVTEYTLGVDKAYAGAQTLT